MENYDIQSLRKKCPYSELFWSAFFPHFPAFGLNTETEYGGGAFCKNNWQLLAYLWHVIMVTNQLISCFDDAFTHDALLYHLFFLTSKI